MKNFILFILFLTTFSVSAQLSLGVKGGFTDAWPDYGDIELPENAKTHVKGLNLSLMAYFAINKHFKIGIEPGVVKRGSSCVPGWQPIFTGDTRLLLNYIEAPIFVSFTQAIYKNKITVSAKVGYGFSRLISAYREDFDLTGEMETVRTDFDLDDNFNIVHKNDHGMHVGLNLSYNINIHSFFIETALYRGTKNIELNQFNTETKNRSMNYSIGYMINI